MTTSRQIFAFNSKTNGNKAPAIAWSKDSTYLAIGTDNRMIYIVDKRGKIIIERDLDVKSRIIMVDWDHEN
jgi:hypothetical protein